MLDPIRLFKCFSDETRLRCMLLLDKEGELCVCELTHALALSQPKVSRHLAQLRKCGLLSDRKKGLWVYYQISSTLPEWARLVLSETTNVVKGNTLYMQDVERLQNMIDRPEELSCCK
ncbi:MAG: metalloregulator ArsR/SmtB family transcription factor [Methylococcales bacterium]|nr:metalloregulator ArsR/SmtB family transcription factor [Methylococcales bacterium]